MRQTKLILAQNVVALNFSNNFQASSGLDSAVTSSAWPEFVLYADDNLTFRLFHQGIISGALHSLQDTGTF